MYNPCTMHFTTAIFTAFLAATSAYGTVQNDEGRRLADLSNLKIDRNRIYSIRDITIRRDALSISFNRGAIGFLEPVLDQVVGAVFVGSGEILSIPPDSVEKLQLFRFTGSPILNERFTVGFFRFSDATFEEILQEYKGRAHEEVRVEDLDELLRWEGRVGERGELLNFRLVKDLLGSQDRTLFAAKLLSEKMGWFDAIYDERIAEEVTVLKAGPEEDYRHDTWLSFNRKSEVRDLQYMADENIDSVDVLSYQIDSKIQPENTMDVIAVLDVKTRVEGERVLSFDLNPAFDLSAVRLDGVEVPFFHRKNSGKDLFYDGLNNLIAILPRLTEEGEELSIAFDYSVDELGDVLQGVHFGSDWSSWYPMSSSQDTARFNMTFHFPASRELLANGRLLEESNDGKFKHSIWETERDVFSAGFNFGDFSIDTNEDGLVPVIVCFNRDLEIKQKETEESESVNKKVKSDSGSETPTRTHLQEKSRIGRQFYSPHMRTKMDNILKDMSSTLNFFSDRLGPYPFEKLVAVESSAPLSHGWPSFLYFSKSMQLDLLGDDFAIAHDVAHQWFGNKVGSRSYRDWWMMEGFSSYMGAVYLASKNESDQPLMLLLENAASRVFATPDGETAYGYNGPVWMGKRLSTADLPNGYLDTINNKAIWIIHMLRSLMREPDSGDDVSFFATLRELLKEFDGRLLSTWDLKRVAEKYMNKRMDVYGDGNLDWFFKQWVFGSGAPRYDLRYSVERSSNGFVISGEIIQSGVSDFIMPVPIYADSGGNLKYLGDVVVSDELGDFRFVVDWKPKHLKIDPYNAILKRPL